MKAHELKKATSRFFLNGSASARTSDPGAAIGRYHQREKIPTATLYDVTCNMTGSNETLKTYYCNIYLKHLQHQKLVFATSEMC